MATLHVRGVPDELYRRLRAHAESNGESISAVVIELLARALERELELAKRQAIVEQILADPLHWPEGLPSPAELIREDRDA